MGSTAEYRRNRRWKETLHRTLGTRFAWTEFGHIHRCSREGTSFPELLLQRVAAQGRSGFKPPSQWDVRSVIEQMKAEDANAKHMQATYEMLAAGRDMAGHVRLPSLAHRERRGNNYRGEGPKSSGRPDLPNWNAVA